MDQDLVSSLGKYLLQNRRDPAARQLAMALRQAYMVYENFNYNPIENGEKDVLSKLARFDFKTIFDVGAHIGDWTALASNIHSNATVHCFEVLPIIAFELQKRYKDNSRIQVNRFGLSDQDGAVEIKFYPKESARSSMFNLPIGTASHIVKGEVRKGYSYFEEQELTEIDFLKIDVEGAEHLVLGGLEQCFAEKRVKVVQFEYGLVNIETRYLLIDFYKFFKRHGYTVGKIYPDYVEFRDYIHYHEDFIGPNYLAVREDLAEYIQTLS